MHKVFTLSSPRIESRSGAPIKFVSRKALGLLLYLLFNPQSHARETLSYIFWPESNAQRASGNLRVALSNLRKQLPASVESDSQFISINPAFSHHSDFAELHKLLESGDHQKVLGLYRGDFLPGFYLRQADEFENWRVIEAEKLRLTVMEHLTTAIADLMRAASYKQAIPLLRDLVNFEPLQESFHLDLMRALHETDEKALALKQYDHCRLILDKELGVPPSPELQSFRRQIEQSHLSLPTQNDSVVNLPNYPTKFVGRDELIAQLNASLHERNSRLISIVGPGGMGKTRLAMEIAQRNLGHFPDGVYWIPLKPLNEPEEIYLALSDVLGFRGGGDTYDENALIDFLAEKQLLLVFDNFEHLVENPQILQKIALGTSKPKLLSTSRQKLNLPGEEVHHLGGLTYPQSKLGEAFRRQVKEFSALQVFLNAEKLAYPASKLDIKKANQISSICRLLEGMPLAIELAAGWRAALSAKEILEAIQGDDGFQFLSTDLLGFDERHKSLTTLAQQSYARLTEPEQLKFNRLSFLRGPFTRQAAQEIAGAELDELLSLLSKSFIQRNREGVFRIHEFLRQFGLQKLLEHNEEFSATRDRAVAYYASLLDSSRWEAWSGEIKPLAREWTNISQAFLAAGELGNFKAVRKMHMPYAFASVVGQNFTASNRIYSELREILEGRAQTPAEKRCWALTVAIAGYFTSTQGHFQAAIEAFSIAHQMLSKHRNTSEFAWVALYETLSQASVDLPKMRRNAETAFAFFRARNDEIGMSLARNIQGNLAEGARAIEFYEEARKFNIPLNGTRDQAWSAIGIGTRQIIEGELEKALANVELALKIYTRLNYSTGMGWAHESMGRIYQEQGDYKRARLHFKRSYQIRNDGGWKSTKMLSLEYLASLDVIEGNYLDATKAYIRIVKTTLELAGKDLLNLIFPAEECHLLWECGYQEFALTANRLTRNDELAEPHWPALDIQFSKFSKSFSEAQLKAIEKKATELTPYEIASEHLENLLIIQGTLESKKSHA